MCGIAGFAGDFVPGLTGRMNAVQAHRGPDGQGVFEEPSQEIALGHVRLAILDLSESAAQPMYSDGGRFVLVFNGEIYNYRELRRIVGDDRLAFRSAGDTEVLLRGLERYGQDFVTQLNGMFAFALWDRDERRLLLARDHLGIKPLYYAEPEPGTLLFASEIKALCAHPRLRREPDFVALQQHLAFCYTSGERTALKGVKRLPAGTMLSWSAKDRTCRLHSYWCPDFERGSNQDYRAAVSELRERTHLAVKRQMVSDVPVGAYLSGGLDSSLITALAVEQAGREFSSYTITYPSSDNQLDQMHEDVPYARRLARSLGIRLEEIEIAADVASLWPKLVYHLDEPIADPAAITCYLISQLARSQGVPVLLSGQGADELFGGYPSYRAMQASRPFDLVPRPLRRGIAACSGMIPSARAGRIGASLRRARRLLSELPLPPTRRFLRYCCKSPPHEVTALLDGEFRQDVVDTDPTDECHERIIGRGLQGLSTFLDRDLRVYLPNHNLLYTDKMGMAVGLEARVPLVDIELVEQVTRLPAQWKLTGRASKRILRDSATGIVPDYIIRRPKTGFGAPFRKWLRHDLVDLWEELTNERAVRQRGWFSPSALRDIRRRSQGGQTDLYMLQWAVLTVELWARQFIDRNPTINVSSAHAVSCCVNKDGPPNNPGG